MTNSMINKKKPGPMFLYGTMIAEAVILLDQLSKWAVFERLLRRDDKGLDFATWLLTRISADDIFARGEAIYQNIIVTPFLNIIMVWNKGVSFGLFAADGAFNKYALIVLALAISAVMGFALYQTTRKLAGVAYALIIGGAVGNVIDRFRFGAVADFIDMHVMGYHWPAFNIADAAIVIGAGLLVIDALTTTDDNPSLPLEKNP